MPAVIQSLRPTVDSLASMACGQTSPCPECRANIRHMLDRFLADLGDAPIDPRALRARLIVECTDA